MNIDLLSGVDGLDVIAVVVKFNSLLAFAMTFAISLDHRGKKQPTFYDGRLY